MTEQPTENPGLVTIREGIQEYLNFIGDEAAVIRDAVLVVETLDGNMLSEITYLVPTEGTSMAAAVGLCRVGEQQLIDDIKEDS